LSRILIVDDDPQLRLSFEKLLTDEGHTVETASTGEAGIASVRHSVPDLVVMDIRMPGMSGLEALQRMLAIDPKLTIIIMTAYGTTDTAIEATKLGAYDYVLKPFNIPEVLDLIGRALDAGRLMRSNVAVDILPEAATTDAIIGKSQPMQEVYKAIGRSAPTDATVLIYGESGTGKELVARAIYQYSMRNAKPFLVINCVAIPETLLESELFGYEKGAFTGAVSRRVGKIEQAQRGTIFLDEIGDMPFAIQAKILRLLQEKSIERLGGSRPMTVDVRTIAATNRNLEEMVSEGKFREDLYHRLNVVALRLPTLRERKEDIPLLVDYFLARSAKEMAVTSPGITEKAIQTLTAYSWPGNVRELANKIQRAMIFNRGYPFEPEDILPAVDKSREHNPRIHEIGKEGFNESMRQWIREKIAENHVHNLLDDTLDLVGSAVVREVLNLTGGNRTQAAKLLGISRPTLIAKIEKYGLKVQTTVSQTRSS